MYLFFYFVECFIYIFNLKISYYALSYRCKKKIEFNTKGEIVEFHD